MCIAIHSGAGVKIPSERILATCHRNNPDFCGYMISTDDGVIIEKGFNNDEDMTRHMRETEKIIGSLENYEVGIHFRIATRGAITPENSHPFPISSNVDELLKLSTVATHAMIHNGVIWGLDDEKPLSDTQIFVKRCLSKFSFDDLFDDAISTLINMATVGSSILIISTGGGWIRFGDWIKDDGIYYSNRTYSCSRKEKYTKTATEIDSEVLYECVACGGYFAEGEMMGELCQYCSRLITT